MQPNEKPEISDKLMRQLRMEMTNPQWQEGFLAFDAREPFTMSKGRDWAMGWLSCRLMGAKLGSAFIQ